MASLKTLTEKVSEKANTLTSPAKSTVKSVLENLKSLSAKSTQNINLDNVVQSESLSGSSENESVLSLVIRYGVIILIISFLGLNIFASLGLLTENLVDFFRPVLVLLGYSVGETIRQTTDMSAEGTKAIVDTTQNVVDSAVNVLERRVDPDRASTRQALDDAEDKQKRKRKQKIVDAPQPDESGSRTQLSKSSNKAGYCYIGEDRGFRSCIKVAEDDYCMSGDIFPSKDICINPKLRA